MVWTKKCDCGNTITVKHQSRLDSVKTCGDRTRHSSGRDNPNYRHGGYLQHKSEYNSWRAMKERCTNRNYHHYHLYGGAGITYPDSWDLFVGFLSDMGKKPTPKHTLDRIDASKSYSKSNCRWATALQQQSNRRNNRLENIDGITDTISSHCRRHGKNIHSIYSRLQLGWTIEEALKTPTQKRGTNQTNSIRKSKKLA